MLPVSLSSQPVDCVHLSSVKVVRFQAAAEETEATRRTANENCILKIGRVSTGVTKVELFYDV